jgi:hypothetical protein
MELASDLRLGTLTIHHHARYILSIGLTPIPMWQNRWDDWIVLRSALHWVDAWHQQKIILDKPTKVPTKWFQRSCTRSSRPPAGEAKPGSTNRNDFVNRLYVSSSGVRLEFCSNGSNCSAAYSSGPLVSIFSERKNLYCQVWERPRQSQGVFVLAGKWSKRMYINDKGDGGVSYPISQAVEE